MTFNELCGYLCETISLIEDSIMSYQWTISPADKDTVYRIHADAINRFSGAADVEHDLVTLMLICEAFRDDDACLVDILDSDCLALIRSIRSTNCVA